MAIFRRKGTATRAGTPRTAASRATVGRGAVRSAGSAGSSGSAGKRDARAGAPASAGRAGRAGRAGGAVGGRTARSRAADARRDARRADAKRTSLDAENADLTGVRALLNPLWCYHGFLVSVVVLTVFGLIMVFSSSTVSLISQGASPWGQVLSQGMYAVIGLCGAVFFLRRRVAFYQRTGAAFMVLSILLQMLTLTPLGRGGESHGNSGWIYVAGVSMQPAEVTKLALCIWLPGAILAASKRYRRIGLRAYLVPCFVYAVSLGLVLLGKDLGTALIIVFIGGAAFLLGGFPAKPFWGLIGVLVGLVLVLVITSPNRLNRIFAAYSCSTSDTRSICYQSNHAQYAMASGGLIGVGLGNSKEKWNYLPAAQNDFIFAIIGEETGFIGAAVVVLLFVVIGWCLLCLSLQAKDRCPSIMMMCIAIWIVGQALVNIGVVVGLFPVLGVPMPFVSAGGSSMIMCLSAAGVAGSLMRAQPQVKAESRLA